MFFDMNITDCSVNYQIFCKAKEKEEGKGDDADLKKVTFPKYDIHDESFKEIVKTMAMSTNCFFAYQPPTEEVRARIAKETKRNIKKIPKDPQVGEDGYEEQQEMKNTMVQEEKEMNFIKRSTEGDASETGLIKFIQPILMKQYGGDYEEGIDDIRAEFPIVYTGDGSDKKGAEIPFSSDIKFNMIIRDSNTKIREPENKEDNICVYTKGAPEKVLVRCTKIRVKKQDVELDQKNRDAVDLANSTFGRMGERVLAFAKCDLDPTIFTKAEKVGESGYPFDVTTWKAWKDLKEYSPDTQGWFPMWDFTLIGLVSLNDPPRPKVDVSVEKCRNAGVKVIMVTGDQPPTAAAIAHKVNIITKPELEYNKIREVYKEATKNPEHEDYDPSFPEGKDMPEDEAFAQCNAIVIHGDTLAKVNNAEDALEDDEIEKGRVIMDWIRKDEVVFARTTPSQKLLIVDACQRLGHVVAVTGDGVNDSPAIKKADIGIAMGTGSEVA